jgi:DNA-binding MarR family transcriptional regulator
LSESAPEKDLGSRANGFEASIFEVLSRTFKRVEVHKQLEGFSGVRWKVDFLVESDLIVEASVQKRIETKIDSTFLKFIDIARNHGGFKEALVFENLYVGYHHTLDRRYFPTSQYRTMIQHGFPIMTLKDLPRLQEYRMGAVSASEISSRPRDFDARSMHSSRQVVRAEILAALANGPLTRRQIAQATSRNPFYICRIVKTMPEVKRLSSYFALSEESILRTLANKGGKFTPIQRKLVTDWLRKKFLETLKRRGQCRAREFAAEFGVNSRSLVYVINGLSREGLILRQGSMWELAVPGQVTLANEEGGQAH